MDLKDLDDLLVLTRPGSGVRHGGHRSYLSQRPVEASFAVPYLVSSSNGMIKVDSSHGPDGPTRPTGFGSAQGVVFIMVAMYEICFKALFKHSLLLCGLLSLQME